MKSPQGKPWPCVFPQLARFFLFLDRVFFPQGSDIQSSHPDSCSDNDLVIKRSLN